MVWYCILEFNVQLDTVSHFGDGSLMWVSWQQKLLWHQSYFSLVSQNVVRKRIFGDSWSRIFFMPDAILAAWPILFWNQWTIMMLSSVDKLRLILTFWLLYLLKGTLKGFDQTINLILDDSFERVYSSGQGVEQVVLGLYIVRGDNV